MATGIVKFFNPAKGFGFIAPDEGGSDVFVHVSAVERAGLDGLNEGDQVAYELEQDRRSQASSRRWNCSGWAPARRCPSRPGQADPAAGFDRPQRDGPRGGGGGGGGDNREPAGSGAGVVKWFNSQ